MEEEDVYLRLTEKGEKALMLALKATIEKEPLGVSIGFEKDWNKIKGKDEESVIK